MHLLFNSPYCRKFLFKLPSIILYTLILHQRIFYGMPFSRGISVLHQRDIIHDLHFGRVKINPKISIVGRFSDAHRDWGFITTNFGDLNAPSTSSFKVRFQVFDSLFGKGIPDFLVNI